MLTSLTVGRWPSAFKLGVVGQLPNTFGLNAVLAEVQSEMIGVRLWSPEVLPSDLHFCAFELHSAQERRSIFEI